MIIAPCAAASTLISNITHSEMKVIVIRVLKVPMNLREGLLNRWHHLGMPNNQHHRLCSFLILGAFRADVLITGKGKASLEAKQLLLRARVVRKELLECPGGQRHEYADIDPQDFPIQDFCEYSLEMIRMLQTFHTGIECTILNQAYKLIALVSRPIISWSNGTLLPTC